MRSIDLKIPKKAGFDGSDGPVLFVIVKNEEYILPHFLKHYEALGIRRFVIYNDKSTDSTRDLLCHRDDCLILESDASFSDVVSVQSNGPPLRFGPFLKLTVPAAIAKNGWVLTVDADEFLVLPSGFKSIDELVAALEESRQFYLTAPMVDFYPSRLADRHFPVTLNPFEGAPYFDAGPYYDWPPESTQLRPRWLEKGVRVRLLKMLFKLDPEAVRSIYGDRPILASADKVPLLKNGQGVRYLSDHHISIRPRTELRGFLAHFKFCPNLDMKIETALATKAYFNSSVEYKFLKAAIEAFDKKSLVAPESRKFVDFQSVVDAGF